MNIIYRAAYGPDKLSDQQKFRKLTVQPLVHWQTQNMMFGFGFERIQAFDKLQIL